MLLISPPHSLPPRSGIMRVAVISAKNHKRQRRKRQSVTAEREKSQTPKVLTARLTLPNLTWEAFDSAKNHKRQRRKHQSVTAKREKSQTPNFV